MQQNNLNILLSLLLLECYYYNIIIYVVLFIINVTDWKHHFRNSSEK